MKIGGSGRFLKYFSGPEYSERAVVAVAAGVSRSIGRAARSSGAGSNTVSAAI